MVMNVKSAGMMCDSLGGAVVVLRWTLDMLWWVNWGHMWSQSAHVWWAIVYCVISPICSLLYNSNSGVWRCSDKVTSPLMRRYLFALNLYRGLSTTVWTLNLMITHLKRGSMLKKRMRSRMRKRWKGSLSMTMMNCHNMWVKFRKKRSSNSSSNSSNSLYLQIYK